MLPSTAKKIIAMVTAATQVVFSDGTVMEQPCDCKWEIRVEQVTKQVQSTETTGTTGVLTGGSNEEKIWMYFRSKNMPEYGVAGLMGNLQAEAGFMPNNLSDWGNDEMGITDEDYTKGVDDESIDFTDKWAYGIAQWTQGRKANLLAAKKAKGVSIADLQLQLDFLWNELNTSYKKNVLDKLMDATDVNEAASVVLYNFEIPSEPDSKIAERQQNARTIYNKYKGKTVATASSSSTSSPAASGNTTQATLNPNLTGKAKEVVQFAIEQGNKAAANYRAWDGSWTSTSNLCAKFVSSAYEQAGVSNPRTSIAVGANTMPHKYQVPMNGAVPDWSKIPLGAYVIFQHGSGDMGYTYGHVGIYVGYNKIVDAGGSTVAVHDANKWWNTFAPRNANLGGWTAYDYTGHGGGTLSPLMLDDGTILQGSVGPTEGTGTGTGTGTSTASGSAAPLTPIETPGKPSGLWPTLLDDVAKHEGEGDWTKLAADVGKAPLGGDKRDMDVDKFKNLTGGVIRYCQNQSGGTLVGSFATTQYNNFEHFPDSGCGVCATAIVLSTLTGSYVNPAEIALAGMTYADRHSGKVSDTLFAAVKDEATKPNIAIDDAVGLTQMSHSSIFLSTTDHGANSGLITDAGIYALIQEAGFKVELKPFSQDDLNACLKANGMVIAVFEQSPFSYENSGHYCVIREQDTVSENQYYLVQSAGFGVDNTPYDFADIQSAITKGGHPESIYVYPKANFGGGENSVGARGKAATANRYILYHTGNKECPKHNGYYCSCGLRSALDIRQEYLLTEDEIPNAVEETDSKGKEVPTVKQISGITPILQNDIGYPTGCEITSLTMLLNFLGFDATVADIDGHLLKGAIGATDPNVAFVGKPTDPDAYGCFANVIMETANKYLATVDDTLKAEDVTGASLENLLNTYVANNNPVVIWVTQDLREIEEGPTWDVEGKSITWPKNEHCVLLTGYDKQKGTVTVADPLKGETVYNMSDFEARYEDMGKMAVVIPKSIGNSQFTEFIWPMKGKNKVINDTFTSLYRSSHGALDIDKGGDPNCPIVAAYDGEVVCAQFGTSGSGSGYGYQVALKHNFNGETLYTKYNHMQKITVRVGDIVKAGDQVGIVGGTGTTKNPDEYARHLDFQMYTQFDIHACDRNLVNPACVLLGLVDSVSDLSEFKRSGNYSLTCTKKGTDYSYASKRFKTYSGMPWSEFCSYYGK